MTTGSLETQRAGRWRRHTPDKHGAGQSTGRPIRAHGDPHGDAAEGPRDCAAQAADAARTAARAERQRLARDLHDSVTQTLISLHLSAQAAAELWDTQPTQARA